MAADLALAPPVTKLAEIEHLEDNVDAGLADAIEALPELRRLEAHRERGFKLWHLYVEDRFGKVLRYLNLRAVEGERLALVQSMCTKTDEHEDGWPVRRQAQLIGVSNGTIQNDKRRLGLAPPKPARRPPAVTDPIGHLPRAEQSTRWSSSGAWSAVTQEWRIRATGETSDGYGRWVHIVPTG